MGSRDQTLTDRLHKPEYTGENRCVPCTVLNIVIAIVLTLVAAAFGPIAMLVVFSASLASIYFRGYLIPGTPELSQRVLPASVLERFGKAPAGPRDGWEASTQTTVTDETPVATADAETGVVAVKPEHTDQADETGTDADETGTDADEPEFETIKQIQQHRENAVDPIEFLLDIGVIEPTDGPEALQFVPAFGEAVADHISALDHDDIDVESLAPVFGGDPGALTVLDRSYPAVKVGRRVRKWPGMGAYLADVASHRALTEWTDRWLSVPAGQRVSMLQSLRSFHTACPLCDGTVAPTAETVESCCQAHEVVAIRCVDCSEHILELSPETVDTPGADTGITP